VLKKVLAICLAIMLATGTAFAGNLKIEVVDIDNDPSYIQQYEIFEAVNGGPPTQVVEVTDIQNPQFERVFPNGNCYTLKARALAIDGIRSGFSRELDVCFDVEGNPTYPNGPAPPRMLMVLTEAEQ
jgi:hypothetical protein